MGVARLESAKKRRLAAEKLDRPEGLRLWPWEKATLPLSEMAPGWVPGRHLRELTLLLTGVFMVLIALAVPHAGLLVLLAPVLGRLVALDLTTHTLPDVYTLPLLAMGVARAYGVGEMFDTVTALGLVTLGIVLMNKIGASRPTTPQRAFLLRPVGFAGQAADQPSAGFGGGDLKLLLAMFAWLPAQQACFAIGLGCLAWLPMGFWQPKRAQPFGVALALGWLLMLAIAPHWAL